MSGLPGSGYGWAIEQRCVVLLSILALTLTGLVLDKARVGEQTRLCGPDGRSIATATISGHSKRSLHPVT